MRFLEFQENRNRRSKALLNQDPKYAGWDNGQIRILNNYFTDYLNGLEEAISDGNIYISPDYNRVNSDIWEKCKKLSDMGFVIGGSTILNLYGFIERKIGDIDLFLGTDDIEFYVEDHKKVEDSGEDYVDHSDGGNDANGERVKVNVDGFGIMDVFNQRVDYYIYDGVKINSPFVALRAKIQYKRLKDIQDFIFMAKTI
ncbi:MAG: hypothetical protein SLAVMIC_00092 [uncultured marine phage]|uniref:Uncharacterized protein n=1 Tax=uncultured marine phage TaxID=707152 RepID=A0A8D9CBN2_9VIRU|nr:MAG: hypothetical protein SLAVMIC_00092 [uncultured marine phage]